MGRAALRRFPGYAYLIRVTGGVPAASPAGAEGFVHEAQVLLSQNWGFRFEDIDYDAIQLWY
jgi:hypothetical protein